MSPLTPGTLVRLTAPIPLFGGDIRAGTTLAVLSVFTTPAGERRANLAWPGERAARGEVAVSGVGLERLEFV